MLVKYGMTKAKIVSTSTDLSVKSQNDDNCSKRVDQVIYQLIVGSLLYAVVAKCLQALGGIKIQLQTNCGTLDCC